MTDESVGIYITTPTPCTHNLTDLYFNALGRLDLFNLKDHKDKYFHLAVRFLEDILSGITFCMHEYMFLYMYVYMYVCRKVCVPACIYVFMMDDMHATQNCDNFCFTVFPGLVSISSLGTCDLVSLFLADLTGQIWPIAIIICHACVCILLLYRTEFLILIHYMWNIYVHTSPRNAH